MHIYSYESKQNNTEVGYTAYMYLTYSKPYNVYLTDFQKNVRG